MAAAHVDACPEAGMSAVAPCLKDFTILSANILIISRKREGHLCFSYFFTSKKKARAPCGAPARECWLILQVSNFGYLTVERYLKILCVVVKVYQVILFTGGSLYVVAVVNALAGIFGLDSRADVGRHVARIVG